MAYAVMTPFDDIEVQKPVHYQQTTPEEDAAVVAMVAAGATEYKIAKTLGRSRQWVRTRKKKMADEIALHRQLILEDAEEDYTDVISMTLYRMREQLIDDKIATEIPIRDLAQVHKTVFSCRQALRSDFPGPVPIPSEGDDEGAQKRHPMDALASAEEFNRNFEALQRATIHAMAKNADIEAGDGDFIDCPPSG
jgi:hypothetical protein